MTLFIQQVSGSPLLFVKLFLIRSLLVASLPSATAAGPILSLSAPLYLLRSHHFLFFSFIFKGSTIIYRNSYFTSEINFRNFLVHNKLHLEPIYTWNILQGSQTWPKCLRSSLNQMDSYRDNHEREVQWVARLHQTTQKTCQCGKVKAVSSR